MFGIVSSSHIAIVNITMKRTGHFALMLTDVEFVTLQDLDLQPHRDGVDLVGARHVLAERLSISGASTQAIPTTASGDVSLRDSCVFRAVTMRSFSRPTSLLAATSTART